MDAADAGDQTLRRWAVEPALQGGLEPAMVDASNGCSATSCPTAGCGMPSEVGLGLTSAHGEPVLSYRYRGGSSSRGDKGDTKGKPSSKG